ncbi:hypothetical protein VTN77DRAFT_8521 [Rasamsonia byssochlamydoides]|uniref:uncharacterized protein n=1 Tax=Rasamsonia byssochlamydoides TaxID=89139 RepID=UPI0037441B2E
MRGTAASQQSPPSWGADICPHQHVSVSNTPAGLPAHLSSLSGSFPSPFLYPGYSDATSAVPVSSPNYFGIVVDNSSNPPDSNQGPYTKKNWDALSQTHSSVPSPSDQALSPNSVLKQLLQPKRSDSQVIDERSEDNPDISPQNPAPSREAGDPALHNDNDSSTPPRTPNIPTESSAQAGRDNEMDVDENSPHVAEDSMLARGTSSQQIPNPSLSLGLARTFSPDSYLSSSHPSSGSPHSTETAGRKPSLSLPLHITRPSGSISPALRRAETLPVTLDHGHVGFISAEKCAELLQTVSEQVLLLDVRPYPQFAQANISGSLNLCIPTTLLKRPSFNTEKLMDTFVDESEKRKFASWKQSTHIIVYDSNTEHPRDTALLTNVLNKFTTEGWQGQALILRGGFAAFASRFPDRIRKQQQGVRQATPANQPRSMSLSLPSVALIAGGCSLPDSSAAHPFFGNIRQNMDLLGGVGQIPVKLPGDLTESKKKLLPSWLRIASDSKDQGHTVSKIFLRIEERELERMREALSPDVNYDETVSNPPKKFRVAGIEKGSKNRYNDIYPFDHSRVRLQDVPLGGCDYVNANHLKAEYTNKSYIATQAPIPDTFIDFWRVVWEQDVRVIVALTAEVERGQIKCHPYWNSGDYGPFKLKILAEKRVSMDATKADDSHSQLRDPQSMQSPSATAEDETPTEGFYKAADEAPFILVRHFALSHSAFPFQPIREITQLQYAHWPDFGTTSQPTHLLKLVEQCDKITRMSSSFGNQDAEPAGQRPVLVHCSAGCGRTGTFCTVDSVLDMLKRQRVGESKSVSGEKSSPGDWVYDENVDLVAKTVEDFRTQRPSMVQNLSQFVLCYESILEWVVSQLGDGI